MTSPTPSQQETFEVGFTEVTRSMKKVKRLRVHESTLSIVMAIYSRIEMN
jgi:hypothetical protein